MKPWELFNKIRSVPCYKIGKDLDFYIYPDDEEKTIHVIFQETRTKLDWLFNFLFIFIPVLIGGFPYFVCLGWWLEWKSGREFVLDNIANEIINHPGYKIHCDGYSLGGAVAQYCGIEVYRRFGIKCYLETFGSPKPLFGFWSKLMAKRCFEDVKQWANRSDIVTYCAPFLGYYHVGNNFIGDFDFKALFDSITEHQIYWKKELYLEEEVKRHLKNLK